MFFKKFCIYKHELSHRDELAGISFTSNKMSIKNRTSLIYPYYRNTHYLAMEENCYAGVICFTISINIGFTETIEKNLIDWQVQPQDSSRLIRLTQKQDLVKLIS